MKLTKLAFAMTIALTGCTSQTEHLKSLNPEYFDKDTPVGEDFYHHVNRGWQKAHPLTDEYARYGNFIPYLQLKSEPETPRPLQPDVSGQEKGK